MNEALHGGSGLTRKIRRRKKGFRGLPACCPLPLRECLVSLRSRQQEERIMAKGQMKSNKETRKPKKDAKKPAPAPALKAAPVTATKLKDKK
jgi:hypothetical protein